VVSLRTNGCSTDVTDAMPRNRIIIGVMQPRTKRAIVVLALCGLASYPSSSQQLRPAGSALTGNRTAQDAERDLRTSEAASRTLTPDDGLSVIAAALDSHIQRGPKRDCSHLVHTIYGRAGFPYAYAPSSDLYVGTSEFQRVTRPQAGDLVVWRGHAGIVVDPVQHVFFSAMRSGLGIDTYDAPYWKERGRVRFYRYIKGTFTNARK
jgi:cell wall-associated NlpC family hydrolase